MILLFEATVKCGGMNDFIGEFRTVEEAKAYFAGHVIDKKWGQIVERIDNGWFLLEEFDEHTKGGERFWKAK